MAQERLGQPREQDRRERQELTAGQPGQAGPGPLFGARGGRGVMRGAPPNWRIRVSRSRVVRYVSFAAGQHVRIPVDGRGPEVLVRPSVRPALDRAAALAPRVSRPTAPGG